MPYSVPSNSPTSSASPLTTPITETPAGPPLPHKRTRSCAPPFSDERGPGAFVSIGTLPKRKPAQKKALFHFDEDQDQQEEAANDDPQRKSHPPLFLSLPPAQDVLSLPPSSPLLAPPSPTEPARGPTPREASSPIILSNGKPLKSSLKSSSSSPPIPRKRVQSAPTTPNAPKNVHFAESDDGLESVRVYKLTGKPANISRSTGEETDSETDTEPSAFPFPHSLGPSPLAAQTLLPIIDSDQSTPLPNSSDPNANIYIETISLPRSRPAALYGSILVRNVAIEKQVALRFTLDDWQTTSEVTCKHVNSLSRLPPPFPRSRTVGDAIGRLAGGGDCNSQELEWDRFSFVIHLELFEQKLEYHTIIFVGRYTAPGVGEWWDNNGGESYRVSFKRPPSSPAQNKPFTAPSTMRKPPGPHAIDTKILPPQEVIIPSVSNTDNLSLDCPKFPPGQAPLQSGNHLDPPSGGLKSADTTAPADSDTPAWKRLTSRPLPPHDIISLIGMIFTSKPEIKKICDLRGDDAQTFVDRLHEVCLALFPPGEGSDYLSCCFTSELSTFPVRL